MYWQTDQELARTADFRERMRVAALDRQIQLAWTARCAREGCHPFYERISRSVLRLAVRFHQWAAPESRRTLVTSDRSILASRDPHGWT